MSTTIGRAARTCLGAALAVVLGCEPAPTTAPPVFAGRAEVDPSAPKASLVSPGPDDIQAVEAASSIRKVTVYSDRALVTREAAVKVTTSPLVYVFKQLPGWVDESSVRASTSSGRILDVRVARSYLAHANEQGYRRVEAEARDLESRMGGLDDELRVLDAQTKQVEDIKAFSLEKLNKDVIVGNVGVDTYARVVDFVGRTLRETARAHRTVALEKETLAPDIAAKKRQFDDIRALTQLEETRVFVTVQGATTAECKVSVSYMLPGATWEAVHELRAADGDSPTVELTSFAVVTQASGEDWDRAELTFSTQSSTAAARIPEVEALTLGDTRAATQSIERRSASFSRAEAAFKGQNRLWNKRALGTDVTQSFEESYQTNFDYLEVTQSSTVQLFQSLQQRGTTAQFNATSPAKVRADGRSVRVPIGRAELRANRAIVAAPGQSLNAAQTLEMRNDGGQSLLPGSVALYQGGAFLGMTSLDFVADGENFAVFLRVADQIKLTRALDKKHSSLVRKQRTEMQLAFVVTVENLSSKAVSLRLADRIPVSEDRDIVISGVKVTPDIRPDARGILRWPLTLQPREIRKFDIQYQIEYPPTLVLETKRSAATPSPSAPAMASPRANDLKTDIQQLERAF